LHKVSDAKVPDDRLHQRRRQWLERIAGCGCDAVGLDWATDWHRRATVGAASLCRATWILKSCGQRRRRSKAKRAVILNAAERGGPHFQTRPWVLPQTAARKHRYMGDWACVFTRHSGRGLQRSLREIGGKPRRAWLREALTKS